MRFAIAVTLSCIAATSAVACSSETFVAAPSTADAGTDALVASTSNDASSSTSDASPNDGGGTFCQTVPRSGSSFLCDDFDINDSFGTWDEVTLVEGIATRAVLDCPSAPGCFRGNISLNDGDYAAARLKRNLPLALTSLTISLDIRVRAMQRDASGANDTAGVAFIEVANGDYYHWLQLRSANGGLPPYRLHVAEWRASEGGTHYSEGELFDGPYVATDEWLAVSFALDFATKSVRVVVRGTPVYSGAMHYAPNPLPNASASIGARNVQNTQAAIELDNVVVSAN